MDDAESLRARAVELGNAGSSSDSRELVELLKSPYPMVRRAVASALGKVLDRSFGLAGTLVVPLASAIAKEEKPQVLQYMLKALRKCAESLTILQLDVLRDIVRNPHQPPYVREAANETIAAAEAAKRLRTVDEVAVQSRGEKRIGDWLSAKGIDYRYDERMMMAGGERIRPDFCLPEFDLYIEYWGLDTPEYVENMRHKQILYQRERKKLISLSYRDFDRLEQVLDEKLSRHVPSL